MLKSLPSWSMGQGDQPSISYPPPATIPYSCNPLPFTANSLHIYCYLHQLLSYSRTPEPNPTRLSRPPLLSTPLKLLRRVVCGSSKWLFVLLRPVSLSAFNSPDPPAAQAGCSLTISDFSHYSLSTPSSLEALPWLPLP